MHTLCTQGGRGGQKRPKSCTRTMYTVPNVDLYISIHFCKNQKYITFSGLNLTKHRVVKIYFDENSQNGGNLSKEN